MCSSDLVACHQSEHDAQHGPGFPTDCASCHGLDTWIGATFDHTTASGGFQLLGAHDVTPCASCHVIPESGGFEAGEVFELIQAWPGLSFFAAPTMVKRLLDATVDVDTTNLKLIIYGGGPMYVADCRAALDRFGPKLSQLYGQGESPMTITALGPDVHADSAHPRWLERLGSVGVQQSPVTVRVVDEEAGCSHCGTTVFDGKGREEGVEGWPKPQQLKKPLPLRD